MCSSFFDIKRPSAMEVNTHVHLQSTVILRMASFSVNTTLSILQHVQHFYLLLVFNSQTVFFRMR